MINRPPVSVNPEKLSEEEINAAAAELGLVTLKMSRISAFKTLGATIRSVGAVLYAQGILVQNVESGHKMMKVLEEDIAAVGDPEIRAHLMDMHVKYHRQMIDTAKAIAECGDPVEKEPADSRPRMGAPKPGVVVNVVNTTEKGSGNTVVSVAEERQP